MGFFRSFIGSFYSPEAYMAARNARWPWALGYALKVFLLITPPTIFVIFAQSAGDRLVITPLEIGIVFGIALALRLGMVLLLALVAQLLALIIKPRIGYRAGLTLGALAYTPVALADALAYLLLGFAVHPTLLLLCATFMLIAALKVTK